MDGRRCAGEPRPAIKDRVGLDYETLSKINLGLPDQSRARSEESLALARQASDPFALALSLLFAADLHQRRGEPEQALEYAYAALELSSERGFPLYLGNNSSRLGSRQARQP